MIIRHVCVEGWAAIVQWGGYGYGTYCNQSQCPTFTLSLLMAGQSWDLASALHPQTLMAYQKMASLSVDNGAPIRLRLPLNLVTS